MALEQVKQVYEQLGADDPLWAVLTDDSRRHGRWDPEEFFATGRAEIDAVFAWLGELGVEPAGGDALDFGCGVGRLSQALAERFERVLGLDISSTMVGGAERFNRHGERCRYAVNSGETLAGVEDASLDFVYSNIALQHSPPRYQAGYLREFLRVLRPGGVGAVQLRIGPDYRPGGLAERWDGWLRETLKPAWKRLRGRPPVQVHRIGEAAVRRVLSEGGARIAGVQDTDERPRRSRRSLRFAFVKD